MLERIFGKRSGAVGDYIPLDPSKQASEGKALEKGLLKKVIGQDRAVKKLVSIFQTFKVGLNEPGRPLGVLLFLGPTGSGKTRLVEALAEVLFGKKDRMIKIDCAEFSHDHEVAKLIGSPPGYLGHEKTAPRISQELLDKWHKPTCKMSILLFDEIEKSSDAFKQMLLGIMEGKLTLGNNKPVDLSSTIIIMTSNIGSADMMKLVSGDGIIGFESQEKTQDETDEALWKTAKEAIKKAFSPEFANRITKAVVFHTLGEDALKKIVEIELEALQDRILIAGHFMLLRVTDEAKDFIRKEGTNLAMGARELKRTIERFLTEPLANMIASHQVGSRDLFEARYEGGEELTFYKIEDVLDPPGDPDDTHDE